MSPSLGFLDADKDGRLPPIIVNIIFLLLLLIGITIGWFGHINYSLRGDIAQVSEDMKVGDKNNKELQESLSELHANIEATNNDKRFTDEACLNYSNSKFVNSLRNGSRDEEY